MSDVQARVAEVWLAHSSTTADGECRSCGVWIEDRLALAVHVAAVLAEAGLLVERDREQCEHADDLVGALEELAAARAELAEWRKVAGVSTPDEMRQDNTDIGKALEAAADWKARAEQAEANLSALRHDLDTAERFAKHNADALDRVRALADEWEVRGRSARQDQQAANRADEAEHAEYWAGMADATFEALDDLKTTLDGAQ